MPHPRPNNKTLATSAGGRTQEKCAQVWHRQPGGGPGNDQQTYGGIDEPGALPMPR